MTPAKAARIVNAVFDGAKPVEDGPGYAEMRMARDMALSALKKDDACREEERLKPCPFCGGEPKAGITVFNNKITNVFLQAEVRCPKCGVSVQTVFQATDIQPVPIERYTGAMEESVERWNTRVCPKENNGDSV